MTFLFVRGVARRSFALFGLLVFLFLLGFFTVTSWKMPIHQFNLWKLERGFRAALPSHPADSVRVLSFKKFGGRFSSAASSCDYFVGEFRTSSLTKEALRHYYLSRAPSMHLRFWDEEDFWIYYPWSELYGELLRIFDDGPSEQEGLYAIFTLQTIQPPYHDVRCGSDS